MSINKKKPPAKVIAVLASLPPLFRHCMTKAPDAERAAVPLITAKASIARFASSKEGTDWIIERVAVPPKMPTKIKA